MTVGESVEFKKHSKGKHGLTFIQRPSNLTDLLRCFIDCKSHIDLIYTAKARYLPLTTAKLELTNQTLIFSDCLRRYSERCQAEFGPYAVRQQYCHWTTMLPGAEPCR